MKATLLILTICFFLFACKKTISGNQLLWQCDTNQHLDSATTATNLVGSWRWIQQRGRYYGAITMADKKVIARFNADSTFSVTEDGTVIAAGKWSLWEFSNVDWALSLTEDCPYLHGFISFCGDKVLFTDSVVDGRDNLFESTD